MRPELLKATGLVLVLVSLTACTAGRAFSRAERAARAGDWDVAVTYYRQAYQARPSSAEYRIALERAQLNASRGHLDRAVAAEAKGEIETAIREYRAAAEFDPGNSRAMAKVADLEKSLRARIEAARAKPPIEQMKEKARKAAQETLLNPASREPIEFSFPAGVQVRAILDLIAKVSGINILYDSTFTDNYPLKGAFEISGVTLEQALHLVLTTNTLFYKVINPKTILVMADNQPNRLKWDEQVVQTFPLSHIEAADATQFLTQMLSSQGAAAAGRPTVQSIKGGTNSITIRGPASVVAIAARLLENIDKPKAEVVIDVEILEVNRARIKSYGLNLSNYQIGLMFSPEAPPAGASTGGGTASAGAGGAFNLNSISRGINTADFYLTVPSAVVKALESDSRTKIVAKPSLRGMEGQQISADLGDEVPVPSTVFQPLIGGGTAVNPMTTFTYRTVGVKLVMTPRVTDDGDVILDIEVENSTMGSGVSIGGQTFPSFGVRRVKGRMRLRDGESNMLAGLLRDDERKSLSGFPGAIRTPLLKQLFSANDDEIRQTDLVMLLTPHIIRTHELSEENLKPIYVGTAQNPGLAGAPSPLGGPPADAVAAAEPPATPVPAQPPGTAGTPPLGGTPLGRPTPQGTPVMPPGTSPIPGTVMMPPTGAAATTAGAPPVTPPAAAPPATTTTTGAGAAPPAGGATTGGAAPPAAAATPPATTGGGTTPPAAATTGGQGAPGAASAAAAQMAVVIPRPDLQVGGGPYPVALSVSNIARARTLSLTLTYNPAVLRVRAVQEGSFMQQGGVKTAFAQQVDAAAGRIDITISRTGDALGATGSGMVASVLFDAVAPGTAALRLAGVGTGPSGTIGLQFTPATVVVK